MRPVLAILGPTASGKSRMAVEVAQALIGRGVGVEILSCDSMAVYRGLDVVCAKPSPRERSGVPHHLLDLVDVGETFTAVAYRDAARHAIEQLHERDALPMLVGGSGLYFRAAVDELEFAPHDPRVRARLQHEDPRRLWERLEAADPETTRNLDPRNVRRVVRAAEILEVSGRPPSTLRGSWARYDARYRLSAVALTWEREELYRRAGQRVEEMLRAGMLDEVARAVERGLSPTASQAVGIKELVDHVAGDMSREDALAAYLRNTKRFIRRQLSWFRADPRVEWVNLSALGWDTGRERILERFRGAAV